LNEEGKQSDLVIRVLRGSPDDKKLNSRFTSMKDDFASFVLIAGQVVKSIGDGNGNITNDIYNMSGGVFTKSVDAQSNVEGSTDQGISIYTIGFSNAPRSLG